MAKIISEESFCKYIEGYYKKKYRIDKSKQPHFWDAVWELVKDINADISSLIDDNFAYCVKDLVGYKNVMSLDKDIKNVSELAKKIAREIIKEEEKEYDPVDIFLLTKKIEYIENKVNSLDLHYRPLK